MSFAETEAELLLATAFFSGKEGEDTIPEMEKACIDIMIKRVELPKELYQTQEDTKEIYKSFGCEIVGEDELFYRVNLPQDWKIVSGGSFWAYLLDAKKFRRGFIYYKGPRLIGKAYFELLPRFSVSVYTDFSSSDSEGIYGVILDSGDILYKTKIYYKDDFKTEDEFLSVGSRLIFELKDKLSCRFPKFNDPKEYWEVSTKGINW